jgi:hypothetical protein
MQADNADENGHVRRLALLVPKQRLTDGCPRPAAEEFKSMEGSLGDTPASVNGLRLSMP